MNKGTLGILSLFIICLFFSQIKTDCFTTVPTGFTTDDFYLTPTNVTIDACDISNENSCCTVQLSHEIATYSDTWTTGLLTFFGYASTTCKGALQGASCLLCSAEQSNFVRFHSIYAQLYLCSSYCQQIYSSCSSSRKSAGNQIVSDAYAGDYSSFCYDLFESLSDENVQLVLDTTSTDNCWDDLPACTADSYYSQYTECVGGSRSLIYQKKPEADCNGGVSLPPTQTGLPCAQSCPPGQFSSIFGCAMCGLGHYSLGSAIREDSWQSWDSLSVPFTTYCTYLDMYRVEHVLTDVDCGWELDGFQINSGKLNNSQSSYLETSVVLIDAGTLAFDYTVDAEPRYDGLTVYVDREVVLPKVSTQFDYTLQVINLTAGYHFIQFVYSKDQSVSEGADRATLNLVQLTPVNYAADSCSPCRSGRFQNSTGKSYCYDCPANTYSNEGAYRCSKCPPNYYSFEGSSSCTQQLPCTEDDAHYLYDNCYYSGNQLKQNQYPLWNLPHICYDAGNTVPPYPNITSDCVPCNPGEHRSGTQCVYCNNGEASTTGESCESCPSGTAAIKALYLDNFDFWDSGLSTDCAYFCGSPGWDLHNDYIDSGSGHGRYVNSNLYLSATLPVNGFVMFQYELNCTQSCALDFQFTNGTGASFRGGPGSLTSNTYQQKFAVSAGDIEFRWTFTKNDPDGTGRLDNARLYYIAVSNVDDGGAINCTSCKAGTYSASAGQTTCIACPPGTFSEDGASECTPCADGYFNPDSGQSSCIACGEGTDSNSDHTDCLVTCQYEIDGYSYDLTPMARHDNEMYGPIYDFKNQIYYLNLCVREHNNNTCVDIDGEPINTFACQVTVVGYGVDLGDIFGYIPLRNSDFYENGGLTVHLTHGENCRNTQTGEYFPRQTYIDIICDPNAGVGTPVAVDPEDGIIETSKCVYEFSWASLYGCHICTEEDYTYIITACNTQQKRYIQYVWVDNPKTCHGGVSLPDTVELSCVNSDSTYCPPGSYLDLTITVPVCTYVDAGFFSIGGGVVYDDWTDGIPEGFSSVGWVTSQSGGIRSASGDTSLLFIREFVERGTLTFTYRVFGYGDSTGGFTVTINDDVVLPTVLSTDGVFTTYTVSGIDLGHQFIKFEFLGGEYSTGNGGGVGVEVSEIIVIGTAHAAEYQTPCPPGTFSEAGASSCTPCPENTYSDEAADQCTECPGDSYSFIGSSSCNVREPCTDDDYQLVYTVCNRGNRYGIYETLLPFICDDSNFVTPEMTTIPCDQFDCEPGQYRDQGSSNCQSCDEGFFWDSENSVCAQSSPGYAGILESGWYNQPETSLPSEFNTGCTGDCVAENLGWRSRNDFVDSGSNSFHQVDVFLDLEISLKYDGSVAFDYTVSGDSDNGLFVFVNGKQQIVAYHPSSSTSASIPLLQGENTIRWVYHQESNKEGAVQLKNIIVTGAGASTKQTACPAGTYSNKEGSNTCTPCAAGFYSEDIASTECSKCGPHQFSEVAGSTSCSECGTYTHSNSDNTDCQTECIYYTPDKQIDLTPLADVNGPFSLTSSSTQKLWLNICAKQSSSVLCIDPITGDSIDTYSCLVDSTGSGVDAGRLLSVSVDDKTKSVQMIFQNGQIGKGCTEPTTTNILMICDPDNDNSSPVEVDGSTICALRFEWHSAYACYVCNATEDYETRKTDCEDKKLTTADIRISDCYGPKVMNSNEEECTVPFHVPILLIVVVVTVIVLLIAVVVVIVIWNMKLQKQYSALVQKSSGSYEMSEVPESAMPDDE